MKNNWYNVMWKDKCSCNFIFLYSANEFFGELHSSEEGEVKWIKKDSFLHEKLAQGMDTVFEIINCEYISECFYNRATQEEIIM